MKKTFILLVVASAFVTYASGQNCKMLKEKKDSFTGKTEKATQVVLGKGGTRWSVDFSKTEDNTSMKWGIAMMGEFNQRLEKGTKLMLKLTDGTILTLGTSETTSPVTQVANTGAGTVGVYTVYYLKYDLDKNTIGQLAKQPVIDFKIEIPGQEIKNPKFKESQLEEMQEVFFCLQQQ